MSEDLQAQIEQLVEILERDLGILDPLTGLYGPRYLVSRLAEEVERSDRFGQHVSLVLVRLNASPEVRRSAGLAMRKACRRYDIPSRLSQDEIAIALPGTDPEDAIAWAERFL